MRRLILKKSAIALSSASSLPANLNVGSIVHRRLQIRSQPSCVHSQGNPKGHGNSSQTRGRLPHIAHDEARQVRRACYFCSPSRQSCQQLRLLSNEVFVLSFSKTRAQQLKEIERDIDIIQVLIIAWLLTPTTAPQSFFINCVVSLSKRHLLDTAAAAFLQPTCSSVVFASLVIIFQLIEFSACGYPSSGQN